MDAYWRAANYLSVGQIIDIEGDFFAALQLKDHLDAICMSWRDRLGALLPAAPHAAPPRADAR